MRNECFLDQLERWSSQKTQNQLKSAVQSNEAKAKIDENEISQEDYSNVNKANLQHHDHHITNQFFQRFTSYILIINTICL
jgi:hypothetical protein